MRIVIVDDVPAAFFINFILIKALMGLPSELIRSSSFLQHALKILFVYDDEPCTATMHSSIAPMRSSS